MEVPFIFCDFYLIVLILLSTKGLLLDFDLLMGFPESWTETEHHCFVYSEGKGLADSTLFRGADRKSGKCRAG